MQVAKQLLLLPETHFTMTEDELHEDRARWLGELAFAGGDVDLQRGWADYVKSERAKLEAVFPKARAIGAARFKELSA